jgi:hypothetical protein
VKEKCPDVSIIVVSGFGWYGYEAEMDIAHAMGARTLKKPFNRRQLLAIIDELRRPASPRPTENMQGF